MVHGGHLEGVADFEAGEEGVQGGAGGVVGQLQGVEEDLRTGARVDRIRGEIVSRNKGLMWGLHRGLDGACMGLDKAYIGLD